MLSKKTCVRLFYSKNLLLALNFLNHKGYFLFFEEFWHFTFYRSLFAQTRINFGGHCL